jgi:hypothetical protein
MSEQSGAPTDVTGGMPATAAPPTAVATPMLDERERATLARVAGELIPAAHGMPSASDVVGEDRLGFVLRARPDLAEPLRLALRADLGEDVAQRLAILADQPTSLAALQLVIVAGYYTDKTVRELIGYPGQMALSLRSWELPEYVEEGLIDAVLSRGPIWRDPATGQRATVTGAPQTYAERFSGDASGPEGGTDGHDGA